MEKNKAVLEIREEEIIICRAAEQGDKNWTAINKDKWENSGQRRC